MNDQLRSWSFFLCAFFIIINKIHIKNLKNEMKKLFFLVIVKVRILALAFLILIFKKKGKVEGKNLPVLTINFVKLKII
ncbi:hypothetical protein D0469_11925 [Peribacillus saganii]|uniref:Uncharacterized protein n=1 Tax=Peribacillus saganii TaxID=2303992 RepID=A0A372LNV3_9BACI|nr:hypothetical protein D0469_11925 [Peribacillus saganii]